MTTIKKLMEDDFVAYHQVHTVIHADCITTSCKQFDLDDMSSPIRLKAFGEGKVSLTNEVFGALEVLAYEDFINQCKKPSSFLHGRKKCDYLVAHFAEKGYVVLIELTSALGSVENLSKPIDGFGGGKNEKCEYQLASALKDLLSVDSVNDYFKAKSHRVCLMAYRINPHTDSDYLMKHPFERYLRIESKTTGEEGAAIPSPDINTLGFEYRRINHVFAFSLS